jgi:hypothetical protein
MGALTYVAVAVGVVLAGAVLLDLFRTVLLPSSSGRVGLLAPRLLRWLVQHLPERVRRPALQVVGPLALVSTVATWLLGLLVAFALVYWPWVDALSYSPDVPFGDTGLVEALYLSGTSLTTLGFGDVVGGTSGLRALTVLQAACGLGVLTAVLGYLPAIYTIVSDLRTANQAVADLGAEDAHGAADLLADEPVTTLEMVRRDVLAARQHLQRFPVLHDFHPPYDESVVALARGGLGLWVASLFAPEQSPPVRRHGDALRQALLRLAGELEPHGQAVGEPDGDGARALLDRARDAAGRRDGDPDERRVEPGHVRAVAEISAALDAYARDHDYPASRG